MPLSRKCLSSLKIPRSIGDGDAEQQALVHLIVEHNTIACYALLLEGYNGDVMRVTLKPIERTTVITTAHTQERIELLSQAKAHGSIFSATGGVHLTVKDIFQSIALKQRKILCEKLGKDKTLRERQEKNKSVALDILQRKGENSTTMTMISGSTAAGEPPLPPHFQIQTSAQTANAEAIRIEIIRYMLDVWGTFGHESEQSFPISLGLNHKGGMDDEEFFEYLKKSIMKLFPDAAPVRGRWVVIKCDSGPGRLNPDLLAFLRFHGSFSIPTYPTRLQSHRRWTKVMARLNQQSGPTSNSSLTSASVPTCRGVFCRGLLGSLFLGERIQRQG